MKWFLYLKIHGGRLMEIEKVHEKARNLMIKNRIRVSRESGYSYYHGIRVANLAITLRKHLFPEKCEFDDIIKAAGYFHDIAKGIEPHDKYGAVLTREALSDMCSKEELDLICCQTTL
jgi:HD superfamily phosphodiesterase